MTGQVSDGRFMNIRDGTAMAMNRLAAKDNHKKGPLNPKYTRAEDRIELLIVNIFRIDQVVGIEDNTQVMGLDNTIEMIVLEEILGDMEDKVVEEANIMITIEAEISQEKGHLQEIIIAGIGVQVAVDPAQLPELIQIEIG